MMQVIYNIVAVPISKPEEQVEVVVAPQASVTPLSVVEVIANHHADINKKKLKVAHLSQEVVENPDKVLCSSFSQL